MCVPTSYVSTTTNGDSNSLKLLLEFVVGVGAEKDRLLAFGRSLAYDDVLVVLLVATTADSFFENEAYLWCHEFATRQHLTFASQ